MSIKSIVVFLFFLYPNNLKNWEFDKEAPQIFRPRQEAVIDTARSLGEKSVAKSTRSKTNSLSCLGICTALKGDASSSISAKKQERDLKTISDLEPNEPDITSCIENWNKRVYLATYPRSGNHWVRYLIEEATHIATSSVYCDASIGKSHLGKPFPWGGYCPKHGYKGECRYPTPEDVVVIKTHFPSIPAREFDRLPFIKTIRIVRHPIDSFYSFYVFEKKARALTSKMPRELLKKRIMTWRKFHKYWDCQPNVVTIRYEDLLRKPYRMLKKILDAMGHKVSNNDIKRAVAMYPPIGKPLKHIHQFDQEELDLIQTELGDLIEQFDYFMP